MKQNREVYKEKMLVALENNLGLVCYACKEVGISRNTFYNYLKTDPEFKEKVDDIYEMQGDFVEKKLFKKIDEGDTSAILFYMKYKGRKRGYTDTIDVNIKDFKTKFPGINDDDTLA